MSERMAKKDIRRKYPPACVVEEKGIYRKLGIWSTTANFLFILLFLSKSLKCLIRKVLRGVTYSLSTLHNHYK